MFVGPKIITDGLVLYLDAANPKSYPGTGSNWYDLSDNDNNAQLVNGSIYQNNTIYLDGANDYINVLNKDLNGFEHNIQYDINWTIETWMYMYPADSLPQVYKMIYGNYNGCNYDVLPGNAGGIWIFAANNPSGVFLQLTFGPKNSGGSPGSSQCPELSVIWTNAEVGQDLINLQGRWSHFVITSDDGAFYKFYLDGIQVGPTKQVDFKNSQSRIDNNLTSTSTYAWGGTSGGNNNSANEVKFSICKIYNRPLSSIEVFKNYESIISRFGL